MTEPVLSGAIWNSKNANLILASINNKLWNLRKFHERYMNYFPYFSSRWNIPHGDIYHPNELYFRTENVPYFILHLVIYVARPWLYKLRSRIFIFGGKEPSISFYSEALLGSRPIDTACVRIRSNCGTVRDSGTANRPELRRVLKVLDIAPRRPLLEVDRPTNDRDESLLANSYSSPTNPRRSLSRDLYAAHGESNLRLIRSTFRRSRCFAVC